MQEITTPDLSVCSELTEWERELLATDSGPSSEESSISIPSEWMLRRNDLDSLADWFAIHCTK